MNIRQLGTNQTELVTKEGIIILFSYDTPVAYFDGHTRKHYKTSERFSATTTKHINKWLGKNQAEVVPQETITKLLQ